MLWKSDAASELFQNLLLKMFLKVTGIDISEENIKFAKATVKNVDFHCSDFFEFSTDDKFDFITLFDVLEHIPKKNHGGVFEKINKLSNSDTVIAITVPDPYFISYIRKNNPEKLQVVDESIYLNEMISVFNENNLEILKYEKYGVDYDRSI